MCEPQLESKWEGAQDQGRVEGSEKIAEKAAEARLRWLGRDQKTVKIPGRSTDAGRRSGARAKRFMDGLKEVVKYIVWDKIKI